MADTIAVMNGGRVEQIGTPQEIYDRPASLFVAEFIGSPPMNFLKGRLADGAFEAPGVRVPAADRSRQARVVMCVRPEDCTLADPAGGQLRGQVYSIELIGDHTLVTVLVGEQEVVVKAANTFEARMGDTVALRVNAGRVYFFDADSGARIR